MPGQNRSPGSHAVAAQPAPKESASIGNTIVVGKRRAPDREPCDRLHLGEQHRRGTAHHMAGSELIRQRLSMAGQLRGARICISAMLFAPLPARLGLLP